jgi:Fe-S-cluster containining protein
MPLPSMKDVDPNQFTVEAKFNFRCHKGIKCFTKCCKDINILLTPYDIIRIKKRLGISSEEFLDKYTYMEFDEKSSHPHVRLKMLNDNEKKCPFVTPEGCTVYTDRPANCRYYPVGQGVLRKDSNEGPINEEFYFFIREPHCLGYQEYTEWTIQSWKDDQEVNLYDDMNREWKEIQLRRHPFGKNLDSNKQAQIYTASYDMDRFRKFVFESKFLDIFDIDGEEVEKMKADEIALMKFGFRYIKYLLMLDETLKVKKEYIKKK